MRGCLKSRPVEAGRGYAGRQGGLQARPRRTIHKISKKKTRAPPPFFLTLPLRPWESVQSLSFILREMPIRLALTTSFLMVFRPYGTRRRGGERGVRGRKKRVAFGGVWVGSSRERENACRRAVIFFGARALLGVPEPAFRGTERRGAALKV